MAIDQPYSYRAYGYNLISDIPLVRLSPGFDASLDTISVERCETLPDKPVDAIQVGPFAWGSERMISLNVNQIVHMVAQGGKTLRYRAYEGADETSVQLFLMGSGLGALLMQRQLLVMHGNAVEIDGACIMCVGPSGIGKSTTAAGLLQRGYRIMSDDICAIDMQSRIIPGMPHIKLWQDAADHLEMSTSHLDRVQPHVEKFGMPLGDAFCESFAPVKTIYLLEAHNTPDITLETLKTSQKFMALRNNTYRLPFVKGMNLAATHFQQLSSLSKAVTVKRVRRPKQGFQLDALLDALLEDAHTHAQEYA